MSRVLCTDQESPTSGIARWDSSSRSDRSATKSALDEAQQELEALHAHLDKRPRTPSSRQWMSTETASKVGS